MQLLSLHSTVIQQVDQGLQIKVQNITRTLASLTLLMTMGTSFAQERATGPLYAVSEFDLYGVKLGMNVDDAVAVLKNGLGVEEKKIQISKRGRGEQKHVNKIKYHWKGFEVEVKFSRVLSEDNKLVDIVEKISNDNVEDRQVVLEQAIKKYGPATGSKPQGDSEKHFWCTKLKDFRGDECVDGVANVLLDHNARLFLSTEEYTYLSEERKFAIDLKEQFQSNSEENLLINAQNQTPEAKPYRFKLVTGVEECPMLWTSFLNWHARVLTIGSSIDDAEGNWIFPTKVGALTLSKPPLDRKLFMQRQVQPVADIQEIVGVAVMCVKHRDNFLAAQYLNKQNELGTLLFTETDIRGMPQGLHKYGVWHSAEFVIDEDHQKFNKALGYRLFVKPPEDYSTQFSQAVDAQAQIRAEALAQ